MRTNVLTLLLSAAVAVLAEDLPKRRAGLWEVSLQSGSGAAAEVIKQCVDPATDSKLQRLGNDMSDAVEQKCHKSDTTREGDRFIVRSECEIGGSTVRSKAHFAGDFVTHYEGAMEATYDPPLMGLKSSASKLSARYLGTCPSDLKPGDMVLSNGLHTNVDDLGSMLASGANAITEAGKSRELPKRAR